MTASEQLVQELVAQFPELRPLLAEHLDDNFNELLPHVFMGDVTRYVVATHVAEQAPSDGIRLRSLLAFLDQGFVHGDPEIQELLAVSFAELLPNAGEPGGNLRALLGPGLSAEVQRLS